MKQATLANEADGQARASRAAHLRQQLANANLPMLVLIASALLFLAVRLGPSLVGDRVFLGLDVLRLFPPWNFENDRPVNSMWFVTDHVDSMIPALHEIQQRLMVGDWASWSNLTSGGDPLLSVPSLGVLTPGRWLYLVLPTWLAPAWSKLIELGFASTFTFLFARRLRASTFAAAVACVIYPLTGFMIGWNNYPQVAVGAVIPMLFWSVERFLQQPTRRSLVPVAMASALLLFGGFPAVAGQAFYAVGGYALVRIIFERRRNLRVACVRAVGLAGAVATGIGLAAFQLLPFVQSVLDGSDLAYRNSGFFNHTPYVTGLSALLPETFGSNVRCCGYSPQDVYTYVGAVVFFLGLLGLIQAVTGRANGAAGLYLAGLIAVIIVLIWFQGWWTDWMGGLPVLHGNPIGRIRSQLGVPVAVLAASGVDFLRGRRWSPGWWRPARVGETRRVAFVVGALTCMVVAGGAGWLHLHGYPWVSSNLFADALIAAGPIGVAMVLVPFRRGRNVLLAVVAAGVVGQGFIATSYFWPTAPLSEFYPSNAAIKYLQENQGDYRIATTGYTLRVNATAYYGLRTLNGHSFLEPNLKQLLLAINPSVLLGPTYTGFNSEVGMILRKPGLDRMGVRYLVAGVDDLMPGSTIAPVPIPGVLDPMPPAVAEERLVPGKQYRTTIPGGALRGVQLPLRVDADARLSVQVSRADGSIVASNARRLVPGMTLVPVPLAAEDAAGGTYTVTVTVSDSGASAPVTPDGGLQVQAVRPPASGDTIRLAYAGNGLVIWQRLEALPRIHWASHAVVVPDAAARVKAVALSPVQPDAVILATQPEHAPAGVGASAKLKIEKDSGDEISVRVDATGGGYIVVSDNIQRSFEASVDGKPASIISADEAGGAVYVPAGVHEVRIAYAPPGRATGVAISGVSGGLILLALMPTSWIRRKRRSVLADEGDAA